MNKRQDYKISRNQIQLATIPARSYEEAARKWAQRESGRNATAFRTTGRPGQSGYFQAFERLERGGYTSIREQFLVGG